MNTLKYIGSLGQGADTHSIYENPNPDLIAEIKKFKSDYVSMFLTSNPKLLKLNLKFDAAKHFKEYFGLLYEYNPNNPTYLNILDLKSRHNFFGEGETADYTRPAVYFNLIEYAIRDTYDNFKFYIRCDGTTMGLFFDDFGNFVNRDYNLNLNKYSQTVISPTVILDKYKNDARLKFGESFEFAKNAYYSKDYRIVPYCSEHDFGFSIQKKRFDADGYQNHKGEKIYRITTQTVTKTFDELWEHLMTLLPSNFKTLLHL
jgi:hypothetical protein